MWRGAPSRGWRPGGTSPPRSTDRSKKTAREARGGRPWDQDPPPKHRPIKEIGVNGESALVSVLTMGLHSGTHIDAPRHFIPGGAGVEALPLEALVGPCRVVEVDAAPLIEPSHLE